MAEFKDLTVNGPTTIKGNVYALGGYVPSASYTAITESDSIQTAFAKIEGALVGIESLLSS